MSATTITPSESLLAQAFDAGMDDPAPLRDFVVAVTTPGACAPLVTLVKARHAFDATLEAMEAAPEGAAVDVRPLIERTESHGFHRWPAKLHDDALMDAQRGWLLAAQNPGKDWCVVQAEERARVRERAALNAEMDRRGPNGSLLHG